MSSDQGNVDQAQLAELATAKLKRQQQRIIDNDAALVAAAKLTKVGRKVKTEWKPFSLANSSDENVSVSECAESRNPTPFDVHAKVFKPGTASSRDSSQSRASAPANRVRSVARVPAVLLDNDDGGDFQLVTGKKMKPSSKAPAMALNAYESTTSDSPPKIATSFNKKEINDVFGNDLPPLECLQGNIGYKNGQVQFCMHPNGDVSAHQWSIDKYQWNNIGHYSNSRRRREGICAATRLKGETEQQTLQQNSLAYFNAVCKQIEAAEMKLPWGLKQINAMLPTSGVDNPTTASRNEEVLAKPGFAPVPVSFTASRGYDLLPLQKAQVPTMPGVFRDHTQSSLSRMSFGDLPVSGAAALQTSVDEVQPGHPKEGATSVPLKTIPGNLYFPWSNMSSQPTSSTHMEPVPLCPTGPTNNGNTASSSTSTHELSLCSVRKSDTRLEPFSPPSEEEEDVSLRKTHSSFNQTWSTNRSAVKDYLNKIGETASARGTSSGSGAASTARTVLHDPMRNWNTVPVAESPIKTPSLNYTSVNSTGQTSLSDLGFRTFSPQVLQDKDQAEARRDLIGVSEPDPGPWNHRRHDVFDAELPGTLSREQLSLQTLPTPQNWSGPFFVGNPERDVTKKSEEEKLRDWIMGGNKRARQDEYYERIKAAHKASAPRPHSPGPTCPPGAKSTLSQKGAEPPDLDKGMTRLLIPVIENLASYVEGPKEQRHGFFARYAPPPEWCIDRSPNGNKSFFGDDWGQPPERIGRDARYRPMAYESHFGSLEPLPPQPTHAAIGTPTGLARSVQPLEGRFRFGGTGRKW